MFDSVLHEVVAPQVAGKRAWRKDMIARFGSKPVGQVTVAQILGGARGVPLWVGDTSSVNPQVGVSYQGLPLDQLAHLSVVDVVFLLFCGRLPETRESTLLGKQLKRACRPLGSRTIHRLQGISDEPMGQLRTVLEWLGRTSVTAARRQVLPPEQHWSLILEDAIGIIGMIPQMLCVTVRGSNVSLRDLTFDQMIARACKPSGVENVGHWEDVVRKTVVFHADHERGPVSTNVALIAGSAGSLPHECCIAGLAGLSGPAHGRANVDVIEFVAEMLLKLGASPSPAAVRDYILECIRQKRKIPGFGHAVLRELEARARLLLVTGDEVCPDYPPFRAVKLLAEVVPPLLREHKSEVKNPNPNVDLISGSVLGSFGFSAQHLIVMFGVSRLIGFLANLVDVAVRGDPIFRPDCITSRELEQAASAE